MSQQEQKSFLVKLVGGFVVAFLGFVLVVNLPSPQDVRLPSLPKAPTVAKVAKPKPKPITNHIRRDTRSDVDKIMTAKAMARSMCNFPDTCTFSLFGTKVKGNKVTLTFTAKNAFGVPDTHTMTFDVGR